MSSAPLLPLPAPLTAGRCAAVAAGGNLINTHIRIGDSFLETVCPTDAAWASGTTQTKILERNGDCGYMAIVQVPDIAASSRSMAAQGSELGPDGAFLAHGSGLHSTPGPPGSGMGGYEGGRYELGSALDKKEGTSIGANVQFHPQTFGTLAELQENWPGADVFPENQGAYFPAGNSWQK